MRRVVIALAAVALAAGLQAEVLTFGKFGAVHVYQQNDRPSRVVVFISGDGGWDQQFADSARDLSGLDTLVIGVDLRNYRSALQTAGNGCVSLAADLDGLSHYVQRQLRMPVYVAPVLVGYEDGAASAYVANAQAARAAFAGAISLGICAKLPAGPNFCPVGKLRLTSPGSPYRLLPTGALQSSWVAVGNDPSKKCSALETDQFFANVKAASHVRVLRMNGGGDQLSTWSAPLRLALARIEPPVARRAPAATAKVRPRKVQAAEVSDLPLVQIPVASPATTDLAVIYSGDGGWAAIDRSIGGYFASQGLPVVGFNSLQYFWKARTPDETARDLARLLRYYIEAWKRDRIILVGYSRGADVLPFLVNRLPTDLRDRVKLIALLGPSTRVDFEFHVTDWLNDSASGMPTAPELAKLHGRRIDCFFGSEETDSLCKVVDDRLVKKIELKGKHHFGGDYTFLADAILVDARAAK